MRNTIHILNASGALTALEAQIRRTTKNALVIAKQRLTFNGVDIIIRPTKEANLKALGGVGGYCPEPHYIDITIDKRHIQSKKQFVETLERTLLHELHHAARQQQGFF